MDEERASLTMDMKPPLLPRIPLDANKYTRGSLLVCAGSLRYGGAGVLATLAAERGGAGYVSLATPGGAAQTARAHLVCSPVVEASAVPDEGCFAANALESVLKEISHIDALCCGPGITVNTHTTVFLDTVLQFACNRNIPLLLDADALGIVAAQPDLLAYRSKRDSSSPLSVSDSPLNPLILTPHAGELKRLFAGFGSPDPASLAIKLDAVIVAKGPKTFIASKDKCIELSEATPALAKAGTGDVLAGLIGSLLAQGMAAFDAAHLGVLIHSCAGKIAEQQQGTRSVTALDVILALSESVKGFEQEES